MGEKALVATEDENFMNTVVRPKAGTCLLGEVVGLVPDQVVLPDTAIDQTTGFN